MQKQIEWTRHINFLGVFGLLILSLASFSWGFYNTIKLCYQIITQPKLVANILPLIQVVDYIVIATTLLIMALSLYVLHIGELNISRTLVAHNIHELNAKLGGMIIIIMAIAFLEILFSDNFEFIIIKSLAIGLISIVLIAFIHLGDKK